MFTYSGTSSNNSWTLGGGGTFTFDGLGGTDTLSVGSEGRAGFTITRNSDGSVQLDTVSGASSPLHATLVNMEILKFSDGRVTVDLRTYFGTTAPPTVSIGDNAPGTATGNVTYTLAFSESVTGLAAGGFTVSNGSVLSVSGSGAAYSVVVAPAANTEGTLDLTLNAAAVTGASGGANAGAAAAAQPIDTKAPAVTAATPADLATGVAADAKLVFSFSEAIQRGAGSITLTTASGTPVASYDAATSGNLSISGTTLTISPGAALAFSTGYKLQLPTGSVKDLAGNGLAAASTDNFTTAAGLTVLGTPASNVLGGSAGNDTISGGGGIDSVSYSGKLANFSITHNPDGSCTVKDNTGAEGTDSLSNISRLQFSDVKLALDLDGNAGTAAKLLGAVFGKSFVSKPEYVGIALGLLDGGMGYADLTKLALNFVSANTPAAEVNLLWTNLFGSAPTALDAAPFVSWLQQNVFTPEALAMLAADLDLNKMQIGFAGLQQHGVEYL